MSQGVWRNRIDRPGNNTWNGDWLGKNSFLTYSNISQPSPKKADPILEYLVQVPSKAATSGREKKVQISIQETREYLNHGIQVSPKSSPLLGMKAQLYITQSPVRSLLSAFIYHC